jgi:membrane-bound lytic murein transglycosylase MltF
MWWLQGTARYASGSSVSTSEPIASGIPLVLVGRKGERSYTRLEQLSGKTLALPTGSAAGDAVSQINQKLACTNCRQ